MIRTLASLVAASALLVHPISAMATASDGSVSTNMSVSATVIPNCTMQGGGMRFGNYDPLVANRTTDLGPTYAAVFATCTKGTPATLVTPSTNQTLTDANGDTLNYTFTYGGPYGGQGYTGGDPFADSSQWSINRTFSLNFTGVIPAGQDVPVGSYSASPQVTINF